VHVFSHSALRLPSHSQPTSSPYRLYPSSSLYLPVKELTPFANKLTVSLSERRPIFTNHAKRTLYHYSPPLRLSEKVIKTVSTLRGRTSLHQYDILPAQDDTEPQPSTKSHAFICYHIKPSTPLFRPRPSSPNNLYPDSMGRKSTSYPRGAP
jgi:hypothetical protein